MSQKRKYPKRKYKLVTVKCEICSEIFPNKCRLSNHIGKYHPDDDKVEYSKTHFYNGVRPKCKCGCGEETRYESLGEFAIYVSGHNSRVFNGFKGKHHSNESIEKFNKSKAIFWSFHSHPNKKPKIQLYCLNCNKSMEVIPAAKNKKYCSRICYSEYKRNNNLIYFPSEETRKKLRLSLITAWQKRTGQQYPCYNPLAIPILEAKAKELGITDLMHAENGGEYYIKELGYWVDGYSPEKNIAFEYDELGHFNKDGEYTIRDIRRQTEIEKYLGCKFIRIKDKQI